MEPLTLLGTAMIKLEMVRHIEEEVALRGSYHFYKRFESMPDACRYYSDQLGDTCNRELLKERVKPYTVFMMMEKSLRTAADQYSD